MKKVIAFESVTRLKSLLFIIFFFLPVSPILAGGVEELRKQLQSLNEDFPKTIQKSYDMAISDHFQMLLHDYVELSKFSANRLKLTEGILSSFRAGLDSTRSKLATYSKDFNETLTQVILAESALGREIETVKKVYSDFEKLKQGHSHFCSVEKVKSIKKQYEPKVLFFPVMEHAVESCKPIVYMNAEVNTGSQSISQVSCQSGCGSNDPKYIVGSCMTAGGAMIGNAAAGSALSSVTSAAAVGGAVGAVGALIVASVWTSLDMASYVKDLNEQYDLSQQYWLAQEKAVSHLDVNAERSILELCKKQMIDPSFLDLESQLNERVAIASEIKKHLFDLRQLYKNEISNAEKSYRDHFLEIERNFFNKINGNYLKSIDRYYCNFEKYCDQSVSFFKDRVLPYFGNLDEGKLLHFQELLKLKDELWTQSIIGDAYYSQKEPSVNSEFRFMKTSLKTDHWSFFANEIANVLSD